MPASLVSIRYNAVRKRSFARHLDLFLTAIYLRRVEGQLKEINLDEH